SLVFEEKLGRLLAFEQRLAQKRRQKGLWGRELVTAALLALQPGELRALLESTDTAKPNDDHLRAELAGLRRAWYDFVTHDKARHSIEEWNLIWRSAAVSPPETADASTTPKQDKRLRPELAALAEPDRLLDFLARLALHTPDATSLLE